MKRPTPGDTSKVIVETLEYLPIRMHQVEICTEIAPIKPQLKPGQCFERTHVLVTFAGMPVGVAWLEVPAAGLSGSSVAEVVWRELASQITAAARRHGMQEPQRLTQAGIARPHQAQIKTAETVANANAPFVSVIIATRNRPDTLQACLDSVLASDYREFEVIVVDNCPATDATRALVQARRDNRPVIYTRENRKGLANAHNCGLALVRGDIVAITDDDVIVDRSWLGQIVAGFAVSPDIACVTGMILPRSLETRAQLQLETYMGYSKGMEPRRYDLKDYRPRSATFPYTIGQVGSGANMAYRTDVLRALGGFDPALGAGTAAMGADDLAGFFAVITAGYGLLYQPSAYVHHEHHRRIEAVRRQVYGCGVGYGAFLAKVVAERPWALLSILVRSPLGIARPVASRGRSIAARWAQLPRYMVLYEYAGLFVGPLAYMRSRWRARQWSRQHEAGSTMGDIRGRGGPGAIDALRRTD